MANFRLLEDGTSKRLLENGTDFRILEAGSSPSGSASYSSPPKRKQTSDLTIPVNLLLTLLAVTTVFLPRASVYSQPAAHKVQVEAAAPNLLLTTLAEAQAAQPFSQLDWSSPQKGKQQFSNDPQNLLPTLLATTAAPFIPVELGIVPARARTPSADIAPNLLTSTLGTVAPAAPFLPVDWQIPANRKFLPADLPQNLLPTLLPTTLAPFRQFDWPNLTRKAAPQVDTPQNLLVTTLAAIPPGVVAERKARRKWRRSHS